MKWNILEKSKADKQSLQSSLSAAGLSGKRREDIVDILLKNRGIGSEKLRKEFLDPPNPANLFLSDLGVQKRDLVKAIARVRSSVKSGEPIIIYGDYDVDGICGTAILWETLRDLGAKAMPFIPRREKEGYGLSIEGIKVILAEEKYGVTNNSVTQLPSKSIKPNAKQGLLITVDNGIVAHEAVEFANENNLDVIIIDHHEKQRKLPKAHSIVHTDQLCAAGIAYFVSQSLSERLRNNHDKLELAAIATVADLVPLIGPNRSIVKYGLEALAKTTRPGLKALFKVAALEKIGTYEIGFMIGPRINASGRIENALTALRLLCTNDVAKATEYARLLDSTNRDRQVMTLKMASHAIQAASSQGLAVRKQRILVLEHETYHQGVIGLIAGRLVEKYYLPAIVISKGQEVSKASARSISGFNIIEAIRSSSTLLLNAGGHPMAAGFTIETTKIAEFRLQIEDYARKKVTQEMLERSLRVDCPLDLGKYDLYDLHEQISQLAPYGIGNPEPVFASQVKVVSFRTVGQDGKHLKLVVSPLTANRYPLSANFDAIAFGMGNKASELKVGEVLSIAYSIVLDSYNGNNKVQLKIKDIEK